MDSKLAEFFARKRKTEQEQDRSSEDGAAARDAGTAQPGPGMPSLRRRAEPAAGPEASGAAGSCASPGGREQPPSAALVEQISPRPAHATAVVPASGSALAKLNAENAALRQAAAESTVGAGRLFSRPTPAQLLKGGDPSGSVPVAHVVAPRGIPVQPATDPSKPSTVIKEAAKVAVPKTVDEAAHKTIKASAKAEPHEISKAGPATAAPVSSVSVSMASLQNQNVQPEAQESTIGAGRLFERPSPAELLRLKLKDNPSAGGSGSPDASTSHRTEEESPTKPARRSKMSSNTASQKATEQSGRVMTPPKAEKKRAPAPAIHPDAVQIGRLDPIAEGDEEEWTSASETETPRESRQPPSMKIQLDDVQIQESGQGTGGPLDCEDSAFAGVGLLQRATVESSSSSSRTRTGSASTVRGAIATENDTKLSMQRRKPQVPAPSKSLQQLSFVKLEPQAKKSEAKRTPAPQYESLQEADAAREAEVLRRQGVLDSLDSLPSADLPLQLEGVLKQGIVANKHASQKLSTDDDNSGLDEHGDPHYKADMEQPPPPPTPCPSCPECKGKGCAFCPAAAKQLKEQLSGWTEFARERTKFLGRAVDDAENAGGSNAKLKLRPGVHDVLLWLRNIGWGQYEDTFAINQIDFDELFVLTDSDLQAMGMKLSSNRLMLLNAIAALKQAFQTDRDGRGTSSVTTAKNKNVFIAGHDKRENDNAELIADQVNFEQKKGYLTWSDHSGKKWKRGFAVIQGSSLHIFKSSDHVVLKPVVSKQLQGALLSSSLHAENCIYVQVNSIKVSRDDIYLCAPDEEERDIWLQHLVAASSLQFLQHVMTKHVKVSLPPIIIMLDQFHVNKTGPYALPHLEITLADKNGSVVTKFEEVGFTDLEDDVLQPNTKGSISQDLSSRVGRQVTIHKRLRLDVGPGGILFFEFKHTSREKSNSGAIVTQYWAYAFVDEMRGGDLKLDLLKRPAVYDPAVLRKGSLPRKDKSFIAFTAHIKDEEGVKQNDDTRSSVEDCSRLLCSAIRSKLGSADEEVLSSMQSLEMLLESLHVLDRPNVDALKEWEKISARMATSVSSLGDAGPAFGTGHEISHSKRIAQLEEQLAAAKLELDHLRNESKAVIPGGESSPVQQWTPPSTSDKRSSSDVLPRASLSSPSPGTDVPPPPPLPGGGGGPPPPPPPPGKAVVSKYVKLATAEYLGPSPSLRMRPFHWKKVPTNESVDTLWSRTQVQEWNDIVALLEPAKMEILFSASQTVRIGTDLPPQFKKSHKTALIDLRRAQNVSIMLSKFRCSIKELKQAVLSLDAAILDVDNTTELLKFVPSDEEIEVLKAYTGDATILGSAECFFLEMASIPRYAERLQVHHFMLTFDDRCAELEEKLSNLIKCLTELTKSRRLHRFMLHVLAVGNFMNHGTSMGNAAAFRLEALNQTINIKSNVEGVTLLHFLASHVHNTDPDLLKLPGDLAHAEAGASISLSSVSELMAGVKKELSIAVEEHSKCTSQDGLKSKLSGFLPHARKSFDDAVNQQAKCQALLGDAKALYAEARPSVTQEELCSIFSVFKKALVTVMKENEASRSKLMRIPDDSLDSTLDQSALEPDSHGAGIDSSFSELAPTQSIFDGTSPRTATSPRQNVESPAAHALPVTPLEEWLAKNQLESHVQVLKLNRVTIDGLLELTDEDFQDLGIIDNDKTRMVKAIAKLKRDRQGVLASSEQRSARNRASVHLSTDYPSVAPRSRGPVRQGPIVWGVCYGEAGAPTKGQKHGWVEILTRPKTWEKFYAKRARNTLVLFASDTDLSTPARLVCLDGVVVHQSEDKRAFVVEARRSIFQETKDDLALAADSNKEAASWEKALIKGSMWHAENSKSAAGPAAGPRSNGASSSSGAAVSAAAAPSHPSGSGTSAGLTPQQVESVGQTFTFRSQRPLTKPGKGESVDSQPTAGASGVSLAEQVSPRNAPIGARDPSVSLVLVQLEMERTEEETFQSPFLAITTTATEPMADVQVRGLPADESHVMTIGVSRAISIPPVFRGAADLSVCLELRHQKSGKLSTRAWTYIELSDLKNGERRLQLYAKPVQIGIKSPKTSPLKGWVLTVEVHRCDAA